MFQKVGCPTKNETVGKYAVVKRQKSIAYLYNGRRDFSIIFSIANPGRTPKGEF